MKSFCQTPTFVLPQMDVMKKGTRQTEVWKLACPFTDVSASLSHTQWPTNTHLAVGNSRHCLGFDHHGLGGSQGPMWRRPIISQRQEGALLLTSGVRENCVSLPGRWGMMTQALRGHPCYVTFPSASGAGIPWHYCGAVLSPPCRRSAPRSWPLHATCNWLKHAL